MNKLLKKGDTTKVPLLFKSLRKGPPNVLRFGSGHKEGWGLRIQGNSDRDVIANLRLPFQSLAEDTCSTVAELPTALAKVCFKWILTKALEFLVDNNERIVTELEIAAQPVLNDAMAWLSSIVFKAASIFLVFVALKIALRSTACHIDYVLKLLVKQKLARDALQDLMDEAAGGMNVQKGKCPLTGGCCLYGIHDTTLCCNRAEKKNTVFWAHQMGHLFVLALQDYTEWAWSAWKKKTTVITDIDKVEEVKPDVV